MGEWISVKDGLPDTLEPVLCAVIAQNGAGGYSQGFEILERNSVKREPCWVCNGCIVTHWAPLPKLPELNI